MSFLVGLYSASAALVAFVTALYSSPCLIDLAYRFNILDSPTSSLKKQKQPIPQVGGLVIYLGMLVSLLFFYPFWHKSAFFLIGTTLLLFIGIIDDRISLKPAEKIVGQIVAALCFVTGGLCLKEAFLSAQGSFLYFFWVFISFFWILSIINGFNLVDVMDGLAATIAITAAVGFLVVSIVTKTHSVTLFLSAFIGAMLGFFWYNRPPARMYLGDAGSLFIGGILGVVPFMIPWGGFSWHGYLAPVVILFIPLIEMGTLIFIRSLCGIPFYKGSPHHFAHFLQNKGWSITAILWFTVSCSFILFLFSLLYLLRTIEFFGLAISIFMFVFLWYSILFSDVLLVNKA